MSNRTITISMYIH